MLGVGGVHGQWQAVSGVPIKVGCVSPHVLYYVHGGGYEYLRPPSACGGWQTSGSGMERNGSEITLLVVSTELGSYNPRSFNENIIVWN